MALENIGAPSSVVFLHIPKTAGQSVHHYLLNCFGKNDCMPARVNTQFFTMSIEEIRRYKLFSGHLDWALLDCIVEPKFVFTILRNPLDRILSFYFFLRRQAEGLSQDKLNQPQHQGLKAALELSCDSYFTAGPPGIRNFLDNHYDNFYTYYFASRVFEGRSRLFGQMQANASFNEDRLVDLALANMGALDGVYSVDRLQELEIDLRLKAGRTAAKLTMSEIRINSGESGNVDSRLETLRQLGATQRTFDRIAKMTKLDDMIWQVVKTGA